MLRLRSDLWCAAFIRRHNDLGHFCVVSCKGDPAAGQIWVEVDHLNGSVSLYTPAPALAQNVDNAARLFEHRFDHVETEKCRDRINQERQFDPDLWVIALELRNEDPGLDLVES